MSKGKGQQVMEHSLFLLEFQLLDGKDTLQTEQKCYQFISRVKYPFDLVTLVWVYLTPPSFFLKALCTRLLVPDFDRSCGLDALSVVTSNFWTDLAVQTSSW